MNDISHICTKWKNGKGKTHKNVIPGRQMSSTHSEAVLVQCKTGVLSLDATSGVQSMDKVIIKSFKSHCR
jgi:hypothetical protein